MLATDSSASRLKDRGTKFNTVKWNRTTSQFIYLMQRKQHKISQSNKTNTNTSTENSDKTKRCQYRNNSRQYYFSSIQKQITLHQRSLFSMVTVCHKNFLIWKFTNSRQLICNTIKSQIINAKQGTRVRQTNHECYAQFLPSGFYNFPKAIFSQPCYSHFM